MLVSGFGFVNDFEASTNAEMLGNGLSYPFNFAIVTLSNTKFWVYDVMNVDPEV